MVKCVSDTLNIFIVEGLAKLCKYYHRIAASFWLNPGRDLELGLRQLRTDRDILEMVADARRNNNEVEVYFEHPMVDNLDIVEVPPLPISHPVEYMADDRARHGSVWVKGISQTELIICARVGLVWFFFFNVFWVQTRTEPNQHMLVRIGSARVSGLTIKNRENGKI